MTMDIYHSVYMQYVAQMGQLKEYATELIAETAVTGWKRDKALEILTLIDETIYTATSETFLPSNELLAIVQTLMTMKSEVGMSTPVAMALLKSCFKTLNDAAVILQRITDDCSLREAFDTSAKEMR